MHLRRRYGAWAESTPTSKPWTKSVSYDQKQYSVTHDPVLTPNTAKNQRSPTWQLDDSPPNDTWPKAFLSDFGSRIWISYRSNFTPIPQAKTPEATSSMTLGVRLRSHLMDPQGFTSDTGWGCMIRSGQSLLANTFSVLLLGRGKRCG